MPWMPSLKNRQWWWRDKLSIPGLIPRNGVLSEDICKSRDTVRFYYKSRDTGIYCHVHPQAIASKRAAWHANLPPPTHREQKRSDCVKPARFLVLFVTAASVTNADWYRGQRGTSPVYVCFLVKLGYEASVMSCQGVPLFCVLADLLPGSFYSLQLCSNSAAGCDKNFIPRSSPHQICYRLIRFHVKTYIELWVHETSWCRLKYKWKQHVRNLIL